MRQKESETKGERFRKTLRLTGQVAQDLFRFDYLLTTEGFSKEELILLRVDPVKLFHSDFMMA